MGDQLEWYANNSHFPTVSPSAMKDIEAMGFGKLGYAFGIEDPFGRVFTYPHRAKPTNGVEDGQWGVPSETVKGKFKDGELIQVETYEQCLLRCLLEEQAIDLRLAPQEASLTITREIPITLIDWKMSHDGRNDMLSNTFGIAVTLSANLAMAQFIAVNAHETKEAAEKGLFQSQAFLRGLPQDETRPAFDAWLHQHQRYAVEIAQEETVPIVIPQDIVAGPDWHSLRFAKIRQMGGVIAKEGIIS